MQAQTRFDHLRMGGVQAQGHIRRFLDKGHEPFEVGGLFLGVQGQPRVDVQVRGPRLRLPAG
jgi:hypothetical protein